MFQIKLLLSP